MIGTRLQRAKANAITTLLYQLISIVCGIVIPKIMIQGYGSDVYGATTSITQFLSYITLLEGGIGGVARAELYSPLAGNDNGAVSKIYNALKRSFRFIGVAFLVYTAVLACTYHKIADVTFFSTDYTFFLVLAISISTIMQYFFGIANLTLLNADQKRYVSNMVMIVTTAVNAVLVIVLVHVGCDILTVKLCSSSIFILRPIFFSLYVKRYYKIDSKCKPDKTVLQQKWTGIGQHLAYYLHTNTDVALLTVMANLKYVAVYAVYNLVVSSIRNVITALTGGMEAVFGDMIAKKEQKALVKTYQHYELLIGYTTLVLFGATAILIVPFVKLYTAGVSDAEYVQPVFAMIVILAEAINCMFLPCSTLPVAANKFSETKWGAYGEVLINVLVSCVLILWNPLLGVAIGTALSVLFKNIYYFIYVSRKILHTPVKQGKRYIAYIAALGFIAVGGFWVMSKLNIDNLLKWAVCGVAVVCVVAAVVFAVFALIYGKNFLEILKSLFSKLVRGKSKTSGS